MYPLIDLKFILNGKIFPTLIISFIMGFTMFMAYQTIPILVKEPKPVGVWSKYIDILYSSSFIYNNIFIAISGCKQNNINIWYYQTVYFCEHSKLYWIFISIHFHANELQIGMNLAIISIGLALINTIGMSIRLLLTPKQFGGVVVGIVQVFTFTGMAIGSVISGLFMQIYQVHNINNLKVESIPSNESYALIFLTAALASFIFVIMTFIVKRSIPIDKTIFKHS